MKDSSAGITDPVVNRLREIGRELPGLQEAALSYEAILPLLRDANLRVAPVSLTAVEARSKMEEGVPLLHGLKLEFDLHEARELMLKLALALERSGSNHHVCDIRSAVEQGRLDVGALLSQTAQGHTDLVMADEIGLDPDALKTLARFCLRPAMQSAQSQLSPPVDGVAWHRGICYVCGSGASLGELQGNNQVKHLRCGLCGADWPARRLQCVRCGNEDHRTLGYLSPEKNEETMRIEVCEKCRGYLKVIITYSPSPPEMLSVEDLATLHLDFIAQGRGYVSSAQRP